MAASLRSNFTPPPFLSPKPLPSTAATAVVGRLRCGGPRSNRGPLLKGRILSTEAILAIQSLKRSQAKSPTPTLDPAATTKSLSRLIRSDLIAILRELLRQDHCALALHVLSALRSEYPDQPVDLGLCADVIFALCRNRMFDLVDQVVGDLEEEECRIQWESDRRLVRVVKGVVEARRRESMVKICEMMRRGGCGDTWTADDYLVKVLSRGLKSMGEAELASRVEREFGGFFGKLTL